MMWCYLFIACFDWKIGIFQQTVVRVYYILKKQQQQQKTGKFRVMRKGLGKMAKNGAFCIFGNILWFIFPGNNLKWKISLFIFHCNSLIWQNSGL